MRQQQYELHEDANKRIAQNVRRLLKAKDWNVEELSDKADWDKGNIYNALNGKINFTLKAITRIHKAFGVDIAELFKK